MSCKEHEIEFTEEDNINVDQEIEAIIQEKLENLLDLSCKENLQYSEDGTQSEFTLVESTNEQRRMYNHHDQNWKRNSNPTTPILDSPDSGKRRRIVDGDNTRETLHNGKNSTMEINKYNGTTPTNDKNDNDTRIGQQPGHIHYQHKFTNIWREYKYSLRFCIKFFSKLRKICIKTKIQHEFHSLLFVQPSYTPSSESTKASLLP